MKHSLPAALAALTLAAAAGCTPKAETPAETPKAAETAAAAPADPAAQGAAAQGDIPAPADVAAPPADAEKTASGLASKVLEKGTGTDRPRASDDVKVHYTGWTTDGKMFDSSVKRGEPTTFGLGNVIPGWTEGVQLMAVGEKRRFWIPEELAYKGRPGAPQGMLVFDVELLEIQRGPEVPDNLAAPPAEAKKTKSGMHYLVLEKGTGTKKPTAGDGVKVHFTAWSQDGKLLDSTKKRGEPASFPLDQVIPGWAEALPMMTVGEKARFWIPSELARRGPAGGPEGNLVFDFELIDVVSTPKAPEDVKAPPKSAKKTASGLAYRVLQKGTGTEKPTANSMVEVHYTGWTTDGKRFDSSVLRGQPAKFPLGGVIPGWTEGLQLMVVGEKTRFWIPEELAYKGQQGAPQGMLVFDVELLSIESMPAGHGGMMMPPGH